MTEKTFTSLRDRELGIDRRQRVAAAQLLCAFTLPAPAERVAAQIIDASACCPGLTMGEISLGNRQTALVLARQLIDELLQEIEQKRAEGGKANG